MAQHLCRLVENRLLWGKVSLLTFEAPELARSIQPGQFVLVRDPATFDPYLRQTAWLYHVNDNRLSLVPLPGTFLSRRTSPGAFFDLLGPVGRPAEFVKGPRHILLIGQDEQIAPLIAIAHAALGSEERSVLLLNRSPDPDAPATILPSHFLSPEIEYRVSAGSQPLAEVLAPDLISWADCIVASGSMEMYAAIGQAVRAARYRLEPGLVYVLVQMPMPCGVGTCYACAVDTSQGAKLACTDGPWFDWFDMAKHFSDRFR